MMLDGYTERQRVIAPWGQSRVYSAGATDPGAPVVRFGVLTSISGDVGPKVADAKPEDRTTVAGATAAWFGDSLYWNATPGRVLNVSLENVTGVDARAEARRIAESVQPDTTAMRVPFSLDEYPYAVVEGPNPAEWAISGTSDFADVRYAVTVTRSDTPPAGGVPTTVDGREAFYVGDGFGRLTHQVAPGVQVAVAPHEPKLPDVPEPLRPEHATAGQLVRVAEALTVDGPPRRGLARPLDRLRYQTRSGVPGSCGPGCRGGMCSCSNPCSWVPSP
ncbi:hypothetical protein CKY47_24270 [Saccharothrix yanglingensis]|uniref:Uncharacterized protein n=1 Tax=Saccharothrix yanglingensis TaxID=659496 RepID=A0ABU0X605_9PSEU|nr:hypothetical protein [Saccharothrix yanglingensis]